MNNFKSKEWFSLLAIPIIIFISLIFLKFNENPIILGLVDTTIRVILFVILIYLFKDLLKKQWIEFRDYKKRKWMYIVIASIVLLILIDLTKNFIPNSQNISNETLNNDEFNILEGSWKFYWIALFMSLGPTVTALIEDLTFKHTLLEKLLTKSKLINTAIILINSFIFGAIHYANFGYSLINTLPFMIAGLFLNLIYVKYRNIWPVLIIHFLNNFVLSTLSIFIIGIVKFFI
ncbi:CPBP family intramembrane glutamic endopeptidase [Staphylococcus simulans]|uniref:CPBP family intramembrane glutamic endopeptidase n=2 Tax=Staphylococcus simulans TaxID=1286 RepID=UPI000D040345|nr:CPBP family intramembrane glutamic endopeptidase [Staphylococcus simulans]PTJ95456.1 CPBP family intramembrane metalloprotease [Staphylococcus simulans]RIN77132.1 CPBP family intramembrane metalloprotease [Staphylococcus simulans]